LQKNFDTLIDSYIENKVGIAAHFLSDTLAGELRGHLVHLHDTGRLLQGGTGNDQGLLFDSLRRSDSIYWLDPSHHHPCENEFLALIDHFISYLNRTCYTGITGYEFHYTLYETGAFYTRHLDQFRNDRSRQYSMIIYLNNHWIEGDGGQLLIHQKDQPLTIAPTGGKGVFFKSSELEHEVLMTHRPRMSITGWLKSE